MSDDSEPGELHHWAWRDEYVIQHDNDEYGPWVIKASTPRKRDFWKVLRGKWQPTLTIGRSLNLKGMNRVLKEVWTGPSMAEVLADSSLLHLQEPEQ